METFEALDTWSNGSTIDSACLQCATRGRKLLTSSVITAKMNPSLDSINRSSISGLLYEKLSLIMLKIHCSILEVFITRNYRSFIMVTANDSKLCFILCFLIRTSLNSILAKFPKHWKNLRNICYTYSVCYLWLQHSSVSRVTHDVAPGHRSSSLEVSGAPCAFLDIRPRMDDTPRSETNVILLVL